jgi:hypothetical protein
VISAGGVKAWWLKTGWPWLKENWWVLLLLPFIALVAVGVFLWSRPRGVTIVEPLSEADERAKIEHDVRVKQLEAEKKRLQSELDEIHGRYEALKVTFEGRLQAKVEELRADPEKLRQAMLAAGRGQ